MAGFEVDTGIVVGVVRAQDLSGPEGQPREAPLHVDGRPDGCREEAGSRDVGHVVTVADADEDTLGTRDHSQSLVRDALGQPRRAEQLDDLGTLAHWHTTPCPGGGPAQRVRPAEKVHVLFVTGIGMIRPVLSRGDRANSVAARTPR